MPLPRRIEWFLIAALALGSPCLAEEMREAPNAAARPVNQLSVSGNACGPAALLASFRCGSTSWQKAAATLPGASDREQLGRWIRVHGLRPSETLKGRKRWTSAGINVEDLIAAANEMNRPLYLPSLARDGLFIQRGEDGTKLLRRAWERMNGSLKRGIPPLLSLRRYVLRRGQWVAVEGHFVTVTGVPEKLSRDAAAFRFTYFDPWGGKRCEGTLEIPERPVLADGNAALSPCLAAELPEANIGKKNVRRGEGTAVVLETVIGRW